MIKVSAIIPAAGSGKRMGSGKSKQYLELAGQPIIINTLALFQKSPLIHEIILVSPQKEMALTGQLVKEAHFDKVVTIVEGGKERQDSIKNGLEVLDSSTEIVVIHDGVRPFLTEKLLNTVINAAIEFGAALLAVPVKDTVKKANKEKVDKTIPRDELWLAQTPQVFQHMIIKKAYDRAQQKGIIGTDDSSLVENLGHDVQIVEGSYQNIKITTPEDLVFAEAIMKEEKP